MSRLARTVSTMNDCPEGEHPVIYHNNTAVSPPPTATAWNSPTAQVERFAKNRWTPNDAMSDCMGEDSWAFRSSRKVPVSPTGRGRFQDDETPWFDVAPGGLSPLRSERMYAATPGRLSGSNKFRRGAGGALSLETRTRCYDSRVDIPELRGNGSDRADLDQRTRHA
jgi:hypothetical protein